MSDPNAGNPTSEQSVDDQLAPLVGEVQRSRKILREVLDANRPRHPAHLLEAREQAQLALELLVAALQRNRLPVPRGIHDELGLMRRLCSHARAPYRSEPFVANRGNERGDVL